MYGIRRRSWSSLFLIYAAAVILGASNVASYALKQQELENQDVLAVQSNDDDDSDSFPDPKDDLDDARFVRKHLVEEMEMIEKAISKALASNHQAAALYIENKLYSLEDELPYGIWLSIVKISASIYDFLDEENRIAELKAEVAYQEKLRATHSRILYSAKKRLCLSPDETFFEAANKCYAIGLLGDVCPAGQQLRDGPGNKGYCDCPVDSGMMMNAMDSKCYQQFTQGPCNDKDEWWVMDAEGFPKCERVPQDCQSNGDYVYLSTSAKGAKKCYKIGEQGPCSASKVLVQFGLTAKCVSSGEASTPATGNSMMLAPVRKDGGCTPYRYKNCSSRSSPQQATNKPINKKKPSSDVQEVGYVSPAAFNGGSPLYPEPVYWFLTPMYV